MTTINYMFIINLINNNILQVQIKKNIFYQQ